MKSFIPSLSAAFAVAMNGTMLMPAVVMALMGLPGYDEARATQVASSELAGIAVYGLLLAGRVSRSGKSPLFIGFLAFLAGQLACYFVAASLPLAILRFAAGLGEGAIFGAVSMQLAGRADAERDWGALNFFGGIAMGLLLLVVSYAGGTSGERVFLFIVAFGLLLSPLLALAPRIRTTTVQAHQVPPIGRWRLLMALAMVALIYGVQSGQWAICGVIGRNIGLPEGSIGLYLAISSVVGFVGALVPALVHRKSLRLPVIALALLGMGMALFFFFHRPGATIFFWGQVVLNTGFFIVTPFLTGLLTEHDPDGALVSRTLVIALIGATVGTGVAGGILGAAGPAVFGDVFLGLLILAALCGLWIFWPGRRTSEQLMKEAKAR